MGRLANGQSSSGLHSASGRSSVRAARCAKPQHSIPVSVSGRTDDTSAIAVPVKRPETWGFELSEDTIDASQDSASCDDVSVGCKDTRKQRKSRQLGKSIHKLTIAGTGHSRQTAASDKDKDKNGSGTLDRWFRKVPASLESGTSKCFTQDGLSITDVATKRAAPRESPRGSRQRRCIRSSTGNSLEAAPRLEQMQPGRTRSPSETPEARPFRGEAAGSEVEGQCDSSCCSAQTPPRTPTPADSSRRALIREFCATRAAIRGSVEPAPCSKPIDLLCAAANAADSEKHCNMQEANNTTHQQPLWRPRFGITS